MARANFELEAEDIQRIQEAIMNFGDGAEKVINDYLETQANEAFKQSIINLIPVSDRDKAHAKDSDPLKGELSGNLELYIHTKTQYNYLYFPDEGAGAHFVGKGPQDFMQQGVDNKIDEVVDGMIESLMNNMNL
ncbi:MAG: hypothetical protein ACI3VR_06560 [Intestinibacter sp.]|uniref:hypothetical protein n=1 Tax=Intestinibacter sp. TaxID=1965304 RepID=UPI003F173AC5